MPLSHSYSLPVYNIVVPPDKGESPPRKTSTQLLFRLSPGILRTNGRNVSSNNYIMLVYQSINSLTKASAHAASAWGRFPFGFRMKSF